MATKELKKALGIGGGEVAPPQYNGTIKTPAPELEFTEEDILREMKIQKAEWKRTQKDTPKFPIDAFPPHTRDILKCFQNTKGFPIDFYGTNMLAALSALIGVGYSANIDDNEHFPIIYAVLVGDSSAGKSMSMKPIAAPLLRMEKEFSDTYKAQKDEWRLRCDETRMGEGLKAKMPDEPAPRELVMNNTNIEGVYEMMKFNPRGLLNIQNEIVAWTNMMNAYKSGDDEQFWLNNWDAAFTKIRRVGKILTIPNPNCSVWGGIQPDKLPELVSNNKGKSGFSARLIFAYPDDQDAPHYSRIKPDPSVFENLYNIMKYVSELPDRIKYPETVQDYALVEGAVKIRCTATAEDLYVQYFNRLQDASNEADDDRIKSSNGKLQSYVMRFALIIEILRWAEKHVYTDPWENSGETTFKAQGEKQAWEDAQERIQIGAESMESAIALCEYYRFTNQKALQRMETPVDSLKPEQQAWYKSLPVKGIKWSVAVKAAEKAGFKKGTANKLLNNTWLFKKVGENYERRFV